MHEISFSFSWHPSDPDGNRVYYRWFVYKEAGNYKGNLALNNPDKEEISFLVPKMKKDEGLHIICEVKNAGKPALFSYRRVIITN